MDHIEAVPLRYSGIEFRSTLEANWAATLDQFGIEWAYEPFLYEMPSGEWYKPDFWLAAHRTFIEVKGPEMGRTHKTAELARATFHDEGVILADVLVLFGWPPIRRTADPYVPAKMMHWRDVNGHDTRFTRCAECSAWQWVQSRSCRLCAKDLTGYLANTGEMPFHAATPDRPFWMVAS